MDDILALYTESLPKGHEVHNFDETPKQLLGTPRCPWNMRPGGKPLRTDYEYTRNGRVNVFVAVTPFKGPRTVEVTNRRTAIDTADFLWWYCMEKHGNAEHLHMILDNLNTHTETCLRKVWGDEKTNTFFKRVTFHYTPCHASWLNLAELEINCLKTQGMKKRHPDKDSLTVRVNSIVRIRNAEQRKLSWSFTKTKAQEIFPGLYAMD